MASFAERKVVLQTSHNFRDVGGYETAGGQRVRWGRLFRADSLHLLNDADLEVIAGLGLRTVIDLRSGSELDHHGRNRLEGAQVDFWHLPIFDNPVAVDGEPPQREWEDLTSAYLQMIVAGRSSIARGVNALAQPDALPAVFHCAGGKDRTGVLAALILSALGVSDDDVVKDYALTTDSWPGRERFLAEHQPRRLAYLRKVPAKFLASEPETMQTFLDEVRRDHGSIRGFLTGIGVEDESFGRLEAALLEG